MIVYNSPEACIMYIENKKCAYLAVEGYRDDEKVNEFTKNLIDLCKRKDVKNILFDSSKLSVIKVDALDLVIENVLPVLRQRNIEKAAFLLPENVFGARSIRKILENIKKVKVKIFDKIEPAENWLFH